MSKVFVCPDASFDASTGTCSAGVWVDQPGLLPELSIEDAFQIGTAIVLCLIAGKVWVWVGKALDW